MNATIERKPCIGCSRPVPADAEALCLDCEHEHGLHDQPEQGVDFDSLDPIIGHPGCRCCSAEICR